jgi:hypothetical protein
MMAWGITAGEPVAQAIDLDDFVYDVGAKDFRYASFVGHRYRCPVDVARKMYGRAAADLTAEEPEQYNREGDERIERMFRGTYQVDEFEPHVELWEIYLPRHGLVCVLADQDVTDSEPGRHGEAPVGPEVGRPADRPVPVPEVRHVPGAALAKAPMMDLYEPHVDANNVHRKINNTIRRLKEVTLYARNQEHDALAIKKANDGEFVPVDNPDKIKTYVTAGAAVQGLMLAAGMYKDLFSTSAATSRSWAAGAAGQDGDPGKDPEQPTPGPASTTCTARSRS